MIDGCIRHRSHIVARGYVKAFQYDALSYFQDNVIFLLHDHQSSVLLHLRGRVFVVLPVLLCKQNKTPIRRIK